MKQRISENCSVCGQLLKAIEEPGVSMVLLYCLNTEPYTHCQPLVVSAAEYRIYKQIKAAKDTKKPDKPPPKPAPGTPRSEAEKT